jgi:hypothetical protein
MKKAKWDPSLGELVFFAGHHKWELKNMRQFGNNKY